MVCSPGDRWIYHQTGMALLGMIIERVSGKRYDEVVRERIFQPMEMNATRFRNCSHVLDGPT